MGVGLAQVFALAGHPVRLMDADPACRQAALPRLREQLALLREDGLLDRFAEESYGRVTLVEGLEEACSGRVALVLEAISEDLERKQRLFAAIEALVSPDVLLASNTSGLSITGIAEALTHPERLCGMHFWNPPHLIPLVEIVRGATTSDSTIERASIILRRAGKKPVVVQKDVPGFLGNRLLHALQREAMSLVAQGVASAADVDLVVTHGFGRRLAVVGPLAVCDLAGLDLVLQVDAYLLRELDSSPEPSPLLEQLVREGRLGVKTLAGFHDWTDEDVRRTVARRDRALLSALQSDRVQPEAP
jgi:3-hydroxybutyryl-CoA dehydrogenase